MGFDEVLESDHVDVVDAAKSIIAPAMLHGNVKPIVTTESFMDTPIQQLVCRRFWSTSRKSLIPCGRLEGR